VYHLWVSPGGRAIEGNKSALVNYASIRENFRDAFRLMTWRAPASVNARMSPLAILAIFAAAVAIGLLMQLVTAGGDFRSFTPYGLNASFAGAAVEAAVILGFAQVDASQTTARRLMLIYVVLALFAIGEHLILRRIAPDYPRGPGVALAAWLSLAITAASFVWMTGAARQAFKAAAGVRRPLAWAVGLCAVQFALAMASPRWPAFVPANFERSTANYWEWYRARDYAKRYAAGAAQRRADESRAARLEAVDHLTLAHVIGKMAPRDPAQANVFTIGVAGWGYQDVFRWEIQQSTDILKTHFKLGERSLTLINNAETSRDAPMATISNIAESLRATAHRMDVDKDLLILVLSSHGSPDGFALSYQNLVERTLDPATLRMMLDASGIKNRVVIVSSCYSGAFLKPLETPDTMVLTASSADRTSFGCADDRRWTWFGEAFFAKALADHVTLADAFADAKATVSGWERDQGYTPSNPQIFVGEDLALKFPEIVGKPPATTLGASEPVGAHAKSE
jgi:hypothetical protein